MIPFRDTTINFVRFRTRLTQGPALLSITLAFGQLLGLLRTTAVARVLGTEIQGDAVIIGMIAGFFG